MTNKDFILIALKDAIDFSRKMGPICKEYDNDCDKCPFFNYKTGCKHAVSHSKEWDKLMDELKNGG